MKSRIIAWICMILIVSTPLTLAADLQPTTNPAPTTAATQPASAPTTSLNPPGFNPSSPPPAGPVGSNIAGVQAEQNLGAAITIEANQYQPPVIPTAMIEKNNIPVYVILQGITPGSLTLGQNSPTVEPFIGLPKILYVQMFPSNLTGTYLAGSPIYVPPSNAQPTLDNLGYLIVNLRKIPIEKNVPDTIKLDMTGRIYFDMARGFGDVSQQDLTVREAQDERAWVNDKSSQVSFWGGKGYVRASSVSPITTTVNIYDSTYNQVGTASLAPGATSAPIILRGSSPLFNDALRVKLVKASTPQPRADITVNVNGRAYVEELSLGQHIYPGSGWTISTINEETYNPSSGNYTENIVLTNAVGQTKTVSDVVSKNPITISKSDVLGSGQQVQDDWVALKSVIIKSLPSSYLDKIIQAVKTAATGIKYKTLTQILSNAGSAVVDLGQNAFQIFTDTITGKLPKKTILDMVAYTSGKDSLKLIHDKLISQDRTIDLKDIDVSAKEATLCSNNLLVQGDKITDLNGNAGSLKAYCTAIKELKDAVSKNQGYEPDVYFNLGNVYYSLSQIPRQIATDSYQLNNPTKDQIKGINVDMLLLSRYYYKKVLAYTNSPNFADAQNKIQSIESDLSSNTQSQDVYLEDEGATVTLSGVKPITLEDLPSAMAEVDNNQAVEYYQNNDMFSDGVDSSKKPAEAFHWRISDVTPQSVRLDKINSVTNAVEASMNLNIETQQDVPISINTDGTVSGVHHVKVTQIQSKNVAYLTIIPGSGISYSEAQFSINIPVEKRLIQLTPEEIDHQINETQKLMNQLDDIIMRLDDATRIWKATCLVTFAALTIKNSFGSLARNTARNQVMPVYKEQCDRQVAVGNYNSIDNCLSNMSSEIDKSIDLEENAINKANDYMSSKKYANDPVYASMNDYRTATGNDLIPIEDFREKERLQTLYDSLPQDSTIKKQTKEQLDTATQKIANEKLAYDKAVGVTNINFNSIATLQDTQKLEQLKVFNDVHSSVLSYEDPKNRISQTEISSVISKTSDQSGLSQNQLQVIPRAFQEDKEKQIFGGFIVSGDPANPTVAPVGQIMPVAIKDLTSSKQASTLTADINQLKGKTDAASVILTRQLTDQLNQPFKTAEGKFVYANADKSVYYVASDTSYIGDVGLSTIYAKGATAEFDDKGRPYCIPTGKGEYAKVLEWFPNGDPKTIEKWNVGADGIPCTGDDALIHAANVYTQPAYQGEYNALRTIINHVGNCKQGGSVSIPGAGKFTCSQQSYASNKAATQPACQDVMDPSDCRLLFGVCDPVMCPASRMNLGGKWQVNDVVQTGIIGSIVLGLPNFNIPYEPVPICLTGILAGLRNIRSLLDGYMSCLQTAKVQGQSVGVCDYVRSIGLCEIFWREAIAIFNIKGGLINFVSENIWGQVQGGGEYLTFQDSLKNVGDSVSFFTSQYAKSAFAAFQGRTTQEIGTEICKSAVAGRLPDLGDFFNQLTQPENPPQFTAFFDESPWSSVGKTIGGIKEESHYNVYYHIYAGTHPQLPTGIQTATVQYSVYLKDDMGNYLYVTDPERNIVRATIPNGGYVDKTVDVLGPPHLNNICVEINGQVECGFGKVSSALSLNYINDQIVQSEINKKISSEKDCIPDAPASSPSLNNFVLPQQYGLITTGLRRTCSIVQPGQNWVYIGTCGKDASGASFGNCWLDKTSISVNNAQTNAQIAQTLKLDQSKLDQQSQAFKDLTANLYSTNESSALLNQLKFSFDDIVKSIDSSKSPKDEFNKNEDKITQIISTGIAQPQNDNRIRSYRSLIINTVDPKTAAQSQASIGYIYFKIGDWLKSSGPPVAATAQPQTLGSPSSTQQATPISEIVATQDQVTAPLEEGNNYAIDPTDFSKTIKINQGQIAKKGFTLSIDKISGSAVYISLKDTLGDIKCPSLPIIGSFLYNYWGGIKFGDSLDCQKANLRITIPPATQQATPPTPSPSAGQEAYIGSALLAPNKLIITRINVLQMGEQEKDYNYIISENTDIVTIVRRYYGYDNIDKVRAKVTEIYNKNKDNVNVNNFAVSAGTQIILPMTNQDITTFNNNLNKELVQYRLVSPVTGPSISAPPTSSLPGTEISSG